MRVFAAVPKLRSHSLFACCVGLAVAMAARPSAAQSGMLKGVVVDSTDGSVIENADVLAASIKQVARSNARGQFTLTKLSKGELEITIRRLGYLPQQQTIMLSGGVNDSVKVVLVAQPEVLQAVAVDAVERHR